MKYGSDPALQTPFSGSGLEPLLEELACAIANSQAALFGGRFDELEACTLQQQEICTAIKRQLTEAGQAPAGARDRARQIQQQNLVFSASLRRMQRHLETLRNVLGGPSETYDPATITNTGGAR